MTDGLSVKFVVMLNPVPERYRHPETERAFQRLANQLREVARPYQHVEVCAPLLRYYDDREFGNLNHLERDGAQRNSREISRLIVETLGDCKAPEPHPRPHGDSSEETPVGVQAVRDSFRLR